MSRVLTWKAKAISHQKNNSTEVKAASAFGTCTYKVVDEAFMRKGPNGSEKADKLAQSLIETAFQSYFMKVLSEKPQNEWIECGAEFAEYVKELIAKTQVGFEYTDIQVSGIEWDEEFKKEYEDLLGTTVSKEPLSKAEECSPKVEPGVVGSKSGGMDIKRILAIVVVIIILIVGYFLK